MSSLLFPLLALAFSSAPTHLCRLDSECVLVRHTFCGNLESITRDQDEKFATWEKKESEQARADHRVCEEGSRQDPRAFEPFCDPKGICEMRARPTTALDLPPPPPSAAPRKTSRP